MLPQVMPMLAVAAAPFDSPEYSFEIKYDGVRALAAVEATGWRLWGRERADYTTRYPDKTRLLEFGRFAAAKRHPPRIGQCLPPQQPAQQPGRTDKVVH
jgi:ATP-dependent DNA ligase